jgi:hypothetical protein
MTPYIQCPSYQSCACNDCPLDPDAGLHGGPHRAVHGEDECRATRQTRERLASAHGLPTSWALLPCEVEHDRRSATWARLTPEQRARRTAGLWRGLGTRLEVAGDGPTASRAAA